MEIQFAPLQGYTDAAYRRIHNDIYPGGITCYYSPFIRIEKGDVRTRDIRDILPENNPSLKLIPQIIAKNDDEFKFLCDKIADIGYCEIDINMGCPFPLQTRKGRGAGLLPHPDMAASIFKCISSTPDISFSIKMRLGLSQNDEWTHLVDLINDTPLRQVTIHPRIGAQQYSGDIDRIAFDDFYERIKQPIVYNGDITTLEQISLITRKYPRLKGIMIGRGMLARPSLAQEYALGTEFSDIRQRSQLLRLHESLFQHYSSTLQGENQLLTKMKTFWEYLEPAIGRRTVKAIRKSSTISKYCAIVAMI